MGAGEMGRGGVVDETAWRTPLAMPGSCQLAQDDVGAVPTTGGPRHAAANDPRFMARSVNSSRGPCCEGQARQHPVRSQAL